MALSEQRASDHKAQTRPHPAASGAFVAERLANGWRVLTHCQLGARTLQYVLIHPEAGVALLEIDPVWTPNAAALFQAHLATAGFTSRFPGHLPVIHRRMCPGDVAMLDMLLAEAFIWLDPISIDTEAAWEDALQALLTPAPATETQAAGASQPPETLVAETKSPQTREARLWRKAWIGLIAAGIAVTAIVFVKPPAADAPITSAVQPPPWALPAEVTLPLTEMLAPPVTVAALPLPEPLPEPPLVIAGDPDVPPPTFPQMPLHRQPEAPDLESAGLRPAPAPLQPAATVPEPAPLAERLVPLPPPSPMEVITAWDPPLPGPAALRVEAPLPEHILNPDTQTSPQALAPPIPMPAAIPPPLAPEPPPAPPIPPLPAAAPAEPPLSLPPAARPVPRMSPAETETARRRGEALAALGDISGARRFLERAALAGSGEAALAMAESFDPQKLAARGVIGLSPDRAAALTWYRHALALGVADAAPRIARLEAE